MYSESCPHCKTTIRQFRGDGRCEACGELLPEALRALSAGKTPQDVPPIASLTDAGERLRDRVLDSVQAEAGDEGSCERGERLRDRVLDLLYPVIMCLSVLLFISPILAVIGLPLLVVGLLGGGRYATITGAILCATLVPGLPFIRSVLKGWGRLG